jgi:PIN domain-containing protein
LLLDTCALLDIIRQPTRTNIPSATIAAAGQITRRASLQAGRVWIVVSELVSSEWSDHEESTTAELEHHIERLDREIGQLMTAANLLPATRETSLRLPLAILQIHQQLRGIAADVLVSAEILTTEDAYTNKAHIRLISGHAPAKKGKQEYKDCVIIEQYLGLCQELRSKGVTDKCVFISSNVNDYGTPAALIPPLNSDFKDVGLELAMNFAAAASLI